MKPLWRRFLMLGSYFVVAFITWAIAVNIRTGEAGGVQLKGEAGDFQLKVEASGSGEVDALVLQLISDRPAPFPTGYYTEAICMIHEPHKTPQVSNAMSQLKAMGPPVFPSLVSHLRDDRYSYSIIPNAWVNLAVRDAVVDILCDGHHTYSPYKARDTPSGSARALWFEHYIRDKGPEIWAEWAKSKTRLEILEDFIDWCIAKEKSEGFTDAGQEDMVLERYQQAREGIRKAYSEQPGAGQPATRPVDEPEGSDKPQPEAEGRRP